MNAAAKLIADFQNGGGTLKTDGEKIKWRGPTSVASPDMLARLRALKGEVIAELLARGTSAQAARSPIAQTENHAQAGVDPLEYEERAAIREHDGGFSQEAAEHLAARECGFADPHALRGSRGINRR